jgi:hypothetical protein
MKFFTLPPLGTEARFASLLFSFFVSLFLPFFLFPFPFSARSKGKKKKNVARKKP